MGKINLFEDKAYDQMEWLEKAVEPYIFPPNESMVKIPDRIDLSYDDITRHIKNISEYGSNQLNASEVLAHWCSVHKLDIPESHMMLINEWVHFVFEGDVEINFKTQTMTGKLALCKKKNQLDDEDIKANMSARLYRKLGQINSDNLARMNEVLDLLGCREGRSSRSMGNKTEAMMNFLRQVIDEDKWRVRNTELMVDCGGWIADYINHGNLAALSNFTRLKCMVHKGNPIYSMEETV
jgi:hypothetical protein